MITLLREITQDGALREPDVLARHVPTLAKALVARWRARVEADIATDPVAEPPGTPSHIVYGSTCLGVAIGPGLMLALQIGDGDLFAGTASGDIMRLEPDDTVGEQTYSLCLPDAIEHVKIGLFAAPSPFCAPDFVLCATDGLAKSFADESAVIEIIRGYRNAVRERGAKRVIVDMRDWLVKCSQMGSGDDVSVAFFTADGDARDEAPSAPVLASRPADPLPADRRYSRVTSGDHSRAFLWGFCGLCRRILGSALDRSDGDKKTARSAFSAPSTFCVSGNIPEPVPRERSRCSNSWAVKRSDDFVQRKNVRRFEKTRPLAN